MKVRLLNGAQSKVLQIFLLSREGKSKGLEILIECDFVGYFLLKCRGFIDFLAQCSSWGEILDRKQTQANICWSPALFSLKKLIHFFLTKPILIEKQLIDTLKVSTHHKNIYFFHRPNLNSNNCANGCRKRFLAPSHFSIINSFVQSKYKFTSGFG